MNSFIVSAVLLTFVVRRVVITINITIKMT